jgi:hypothetical protein
MKLGIVDDDNEYKVSVTGVVTKKLIDDDESS